MRTVDLTDWLAGWLFQVLLQLGGAQRAASPSRAPLSPGLAVPVLPRLERYLSFSLPVSAAYNLRACFARRIRFQPGFVLVNALVVGRRIDGWPGREDGGG